MPIASIEGGDLCKVWEIKTLGLVGDGDARKLLEDVAKQVQPIMRKLKWKVNLLTEFCPPNPSLLGLNIDGGREIRIRLRRHPSDSRLFSYEETLGTMLHELTHIKCGPHDAAFYRLLDELKKECEELMVKGITGTGQGFDTRGQRLGGYRHNPPPTNLRQVALAAAEKRARMGATMPSGPRRLGGDSEIMNALSPIQAAAMAAERRLRDDVWCAAPVTAGEDGLDKAREREGATGSPQVDSGKRFDDPASKENRGFGENSMNSSLANRYPSGNLKSEPSTLNRGSNNIFSSGGTGNHPLRAEPEDSGSNHTASVVGSSQRSGGLLRGGHGNLAQSGAEGPSAGRSQNNPILIDGVEHNSHSGQNSPPWACHICTLLNKAASAACEACGTPRVSTVEDDTNSWTCKFCTLKNSRLLTSCGACEQWRFSHGAPIATRGPYVGT